MDLEDYLKTENNGHVIDIVYYLQNYPGGWENMECLSIQGTTKIMAGHLEIMAEKYKSFMLDRAENLLHEYFGDAEYWSARRSMRFADHLKDIADKFRNDELNSNDENDSTVMPE